MNLKIEKGVPLPRRQQSRGLTQVMRRLEIGDSVLIPDSPVSNLHTLAGRIGISICSQAEHGQRRVWRTA